MSDPRITQQLQEFLAWESNQRQRGVTLEAVAEMVQRIGNGFQTVTEHLHRTQVAVQRIGARQLHNEADLLRYGKRIASLEHQVALISQRPDVPDWHRDESEVTGNHRVADLHAHIGQLTAQIDALQSESKERRDSHIDWRRTWRKAIITGFVGLIFTSVAGCAGYALSELQHKQSAPVAR